MNLQQKAKTLFDRNAGKDEVHFTSDGYGFFIEGHATGHASGLKDKTVTKVTRDEVKDLKVEADKPVVSIKPLGKMNKTELQAEVAKRPGIVVAGDAANKDVVKAIVEFDKAKLAEEEAGAEEETATPDATPVV